MVSSAMDFTFKFEWITVTDIDDRLLKVNETRLPYANDHY